ncbi:MAG: acyl carrier protein [Rhodocyclaceae bacterium]|nr:acyl carrier protein [Rhodocyclaceae bacterium]
MTDTLHDLQSMISERYGVPREDLDPHRSLDAFGLDSLGVIELMFGIEDHYGIKLPENGADVRTLDELAQWVERVRNASAGASPAP